MTALGDIRAPAVPQGVRYPRPGDLPAYAWPGGYPLLYLCDDGYYICPACANDPSNPVHETGEADGWRIDGYYIHWEGPAELCVHCGRAVESAYGDPDATEGGEL